MNAPIEVDMLVICTGEGGTAAAQKCAKARRRVATVNFRPYGGTCVLRNCDPKKVLIRAAVAVAYPHQLVGFGIAAPATIYWPALMRFKHSFTDRVSDGREASLQKTGVATYNGPARFLDANTVQIGDQQMQAKQFILATGAQPRQLQIPGEELLPDSTVFLDLTELPTDITSIGGGYIASEFAHLVARCSVKARIVHRGTRLLKNFDTDPVEQLVVSSREIGIEILLITAVFGIEQLRDEQLQLQLHVESAGQHFTLSTSTAVHAAGQQPALQELTLERDGVAYGSKGIAVNKYLQEPPRPEMNAIGDAADSGLPLTPMAASNLLKGNYTPR